MNNKKDEGHKRDNIDKRRKSYIKPSIDSQLYQERGALVCNKMFNQNPACAAHSDVS